MYLHVSIHFTQRHYLTRAWTISEQVVGDAAITTMGSPMSTNSHKRWMCEITVEKHRNKFTSWIERRTVGRDCTTVVDFEGELNVVVLHGLLLCIGMEA